MYGYRVKKRKKKGNDKKKRRGTKDGEGGGEVEEKQTRVNDITPPSMVAGQECPDRIKVGPKIPPSESITH